MKKKALQQSLALITMMLFLSISVFGFTPEAFPRENADAEGTESMAEMAQEGEDTKTDTTNLVDENPEFRTAAEEMASVAEEMASAAGEADTRSAKEDAPEEKDSKGIMILFTSDVHCGVDQGFGLAGLYKIRQTLEDQGYATLLVDDGDAVQGETIGMLSRGEDIIDLMNDMHYDLAIPGNHEFDYGMDQFMKLTDMAEFPYISCNFTKEGKLVFDPYVIREIEGVKIGFVGVTTPQTLASSTPKEFMNDEGEFIYGFMQDKTGEKLYQAVQEAVDGARAEGADLIYLVAHLGNMEAAHPWNYKDVVSHTTGIDVVLDGHSHDTDQVIMKNGDGRDVDRSAVGTKLNSVGYSRISPEGAILETDIWSWPNKESAPELFHIENEVGEKVEKKEKEIEDRLGNKIAETGFALTINDPEAKTSSGQPIRMVRSAETNLADFCADAYRTQTGADIAFLNGGGIRDSIDKGTISMQDLLKVFPFNNDLCIVEVTGQQILDALEWGSTRVPEEFGGFLQVSGLTYEIHTYIDSTCTSDENSSFTGVTGDRRVRNVKVGDEDLDPEKTYTVVGNDFTLLERGDGFSMFDGAKIIGTRVKSDIQTLCDYLTQELGGVVPDSYADPCGDGRIVIVETAPGN